METVQIGELRGRRFTLIGLGRRTHVALARFLIRHGAVVRISERKPLDELREELALISDLPVEVQAGGHRDEHVADADAVFVTPGAPRDLPILEAARRRGIPITNEIELVFERCRAPIVGITGSVGKTTTTSLIGRILAAAGRQVIVGGNIGVPVIEVVDDLGPDAWVVLELSSFQLETLRRRPLVGAILNVTPNHLDRHPTFEHYRESKFNLLRHQLPTDWAILGADDPVAASFAERCPGQVRWFSIQHTVAAGAFLAGDELRVRDSGSETSFARVGDLILPGRHNLLNVLAAAAIARSIGIGVSAIAEVAKSFPGVEHRLEFVRELDGVLYFNDSIATAPERTAAALRAFDRPVVLIAGGRSKHLPLGEVAMLVRQKARAVVTFGEMADEIMTALREPNREAHPPIEQVGNLVDAVDCARRLAQPGDVVVLSPAGTSFDQFRDFEERGQRFKEAVRALAEGRR
ncbi:MAG TPA: UDP-N-acetylmuramoyl-L-alanine--D-glutamate ligase [Chloroflexota bacterium]|nr:UDP-N-acetylmuramoyl-L-alanine--D-glutamate ligase [Chloroflexota bacterium]